VSALSTVRAYLQHHRLVLFWLVAVVGLAAPWLAHARPHHMREAQTTLRDCEVQNVHDGDTITVLCDTHTDRAIKVKVRLYCIDAPELKQEPWGKGARDSLRQLVDHDRVDVRVFDRDRYGRSVGEVWVGKRNLNLTMVERGEAAVYRKYCPLSGYDRAERQSQAERRGIWRAPGLQQRPWEWRHSERS